jgi:acyl-CoA dehydrogenase
LLAVGDIFTNIAYGQLIIESSKMFKIEDDLLDEIFDVLVRDFSKYALSLYSKASNSDDQKEFSMKMIKTPVPNPERFSKIFQEYAYKMKDQYKMND